MKQSNRIIVNTLAQYIRTFLGLIIALYSTRVVLMQLGSSDFGLYSLVGSVLAFLSFFNTAITRSTQRFLSYYMGKSDNEYQSVVLFNSMMLNIGVSLITAIIMFSIEPLLFSGFLNIAPEQIPTAKILYRIMIVSVFFTMNMTTFNAVFVSHENIVFSSAIYVLGALLKLLAALLLAYFDSKLIAYGLLLCGIIILEYLIYVICSAIKYEEVRGIFKHSRIERSLQKSLLSFSGWNLYGTLCIAGRDQGYAVVINKLVSLEANAGFGIANQVSGQVNSFVYSIATSMSPVITRSEGEGNRKKMINYTVSASKISAIIYMIVAIPFVFEIDYILQIWLGNPPLYSAAFVVSILVANLMESFSIGFRTGVQAIGKIRNYSLMFYTVKILSIPASVIMILLGCSPLYVLIPYIAVELIGAFISIYYFSKYTETNYSYYLNQVFIKLIPAFIASVITCFAIVSVLHNPVVRLIAIIVIPTIVIAAVAYKIVLTGDEKEVLKGIASKIIKNRK